MTISKSSLSHLSLFLNRQLFKLTAFFLVTVSVISFIIYSQDGLALAYNDARSHLDIGRRVVDGLKPGLAQLGSVWLPLPHLLMVPTVWIDFMWHSGLSGSIQSMLAFVATGLIIYKFLEKLGVAALGRIVGVLVFTANINILYLQSTAMTELLLIASMTAGCYYLLIWHETDNLLSLIKAAFWIMISTLVRYDGWFLLLWACILVFLQSWRKKNYSAAEGSVVLFATLAGFGIGIWFLWNLLIFKDPLYFAFGPFSAYAQQSQLAAAGVLATKGNLIFSTVIYLYALLYNSYTLSALLGGLAAFFLWTDTRLSSSQRLATIALLAPLGFNILALYLGHSVLFVQGLSGNTWFNVRYGIMLLPSIAIFVGYLIHRLRRYRWLIIGLLIFVTIFAFANHDAVTIDDATVGSSHKNVSEVANYLKRNVPSQPGFILISAASHDAIIFSSGLPMSRFIHEGTGAYWEAAATAPDRWAKWIVMRSHDPGDLTWKLVSTSPGFAKFRLVDHYPFADVYELEPQYWPGLHTQPEFTHQK